MMSSSSLPPRAPRSLRPTWRTMAASIGIGKAAIQDTHLLRLEEHRARTMVKQACTALQRRRVQHPLACKRARSLADQWRNVSRVSRATRARNKADSWKKRAGIAAVAGVGVKKVVSWLSIQKQRKPRLNRNRIEHTTSTATASA